MKEKAHHARMAAFLANKRVQRKTQSCTREDSTIMCGMQSSRVVR